jgi:hypothetical protein
MWLGLTAVVKNSYLIDDPDGEDFFSGRAYTFGDVCDEKLHLDRQSMCVDCAHAAVTVTGFTVAAVIVVLPTLMNDRSRSDVEQDCNVEKIAGFIGGVLSGLLVLGGLIAFKYQCGDSLPHSVEAESQDVQLTWSFGTGLWCMFSAMDLLFLNAIIHLLVPTPEECWEPSNEKLPLLPETVDTTVNDDLEKAKKIDTSVDDKAEQGEGEIPSNKSALLYPDQWQKLPKGPANQMTEDEMQAAEAASAERKRKEKQKHEEYQKEQQAAVNDLRSG